MLGPVCSQDLAPAAEREALGRLKTGRHGGGGGTGHPEGRVMCPKSSEQGGWGLRGLAAPHPAGSREAARTRGVYPCLHSRRVATAPGSTPLRPALAQNRPPRARFPCDSQLWALLCCPKSLKGSLERRGWGNAGCPPCCTGAGMCSGTASRDGALREIPLEAVTQRRAGERQAANQGGNCPQYIILSQPNFLPLNSPFFPYIGEKSASSPLPPFQPLPSWKQFSPCKSKGFSKPGS